MKITLLFFLSFCFTMNAFSQTAKEYFMKGSNHDNGGRPAEAIADFTNAIKLNPQYDDAYWRRANIKKGLGDIDGAIADYNAAIKINPKKISPYINLAYIKSEKQDHVGALADYTKMIALFPNSPTPYFERAKVKMILKDSKGALADINKTILLDPKDDNAFLVRGKLKAEQNDLKGAILDFDKGYANSYELEAAYNSAVAKNMLKDYKASLITYDYLIETADMINSTTKNSYKLYEKPKLTGEQIKIREEQLREADALSSIYYNNRGLVKINMQDYTGAMTDYNKAIELNPGNPEFYYARAALKFATKDSIGAIADYSKTIELTPLSPEPYYYRGVLKFEKHEFSAAIADLTKAIELNPDLADAYYYRAYAKSGGNIQKETICADLKKAVSLGHEQAAIEVKNSCK